MKKALWIILGILVVLVLVLGYFGFVPGLSNLMGANKPVDLGVTYSEADLAQGRALTGVELQPLTEAEKSLEFSGEKSITGDYSQSVISAMINGAKYKYYPITNGQVKISDDGTVETSGNFDILKAVRWSNDLGADKSVTDQASSYIGNVSANPSFYLKGKMSVKDNQISLNIAEARVSRFSAPSSVINQYQGQLADFVEQRIANVPGMRVKSAEFANGKLILDAKYPAVEKSTR